MDCSRSQIQRLDDLQSVRASLAECDTLTALIGNDLRLCRTTAMV
jgi:hypothetical protein